MSGSHSKAPGFAGGYLLLVAVAALTSTWREVLLIVKSETVLRWRRQGFRLFWQRKSRRTRTVPRLSAGVIGLIRRMARENSTWGAERIRGELLKLGIAVSKRTIQRYAALSRKPGNGQRWTTFLKNHTVWACDFVQTYDCWFRPILAFFIVDVNDRRVVRVGVTRSPSAEWTAQHLREATPFGEGSEVLIRDRDSKFGAAFDRVAQGAVIRVVVTPVKTPNMNAVCERFIGSARRECLDHVLLLGENHMKSVLGEYALAYLNHAQPHQGIEQRVPMKPLKGSYRTGAHVIGVPILGGLHHDYRVAA